jgi:phosphatidate cytidylyltransferase
MAASLVSNETAAGRQQRLHDLGPRVASALVLAPAAIAAAYAGGPWIAGACGAASVAMSYEWTRMSEPASKGTAFFWCLLGVLGAVMAASWGEMAIAFGWLAACGGASAVRRRSLPHMLETFGGVLYVGVPCALFLALRAYYPGGREAVLGMFMIIWTTDAAAYFAGTFVGGPRVSRRLSPNKTWSGLVGGTLAGLAAGLGCAAVFGGPPVLWAASAAALAATGLGGDLFESLLKRRFGVKDASGLIPGHGGFLDRLDGLMFATVLASAAFMSRALGRTGINIIGRLMGLILAALAIQFVIDGAREAFPRMFG